VTTPDVEPPRGRPTTAREYQALVRNRLIESRLTPNAISLTGFALCVVAAVLVW
jgi:CDP-diacylglycerol---glycerol-3-phosphate 3-phosphatidyltransferase